MSEQYPKAFGNFIVCKEIDGKEYEQEAAAGEVKMFLPDELKERTQDSKALFGKVVSVGNYVPDDTINTGAIVIFANHDYTKVNYLNDMYFIINDSQVMATLNEG